jgi:hypothetical protein
MTKNALCGRALLLSGCAEPATLYFARMKRGSRKIQ